MFELSAFYTTVLLISLYAISAGIFYVAADVLAKRPAAQPRDDHRLQGRHA
jgi:hypothetical protein